MRGLDLDCFLVSNPTDVGYLTGFLGGDSLLLVPVSGRAKPILISDGRYEQELLASVPWVRLVLRTGSFASALGDVFASAGIQRCGVQSETMTLAQRADNAKAVGARRLVATRGVVGKQRRRKDASELTLIRKAIRIQEQALLTVLPTVEPGQSELSIAARLEAAMKEGGSSGVGFDTSVAVGANAALPHYRPGQARTRAGKTLLIDWGATWRGYRGDLTRTFTLGRWSRAMREIYDIVLEAHERAAAALAPGTINHEIDAIARDWITRHGYGDRFGHGLGHGMGMDVHEDPRLNPRNVRTVLEPGHVVTIEPGIYLPGVGGVRIEDDYVVTERSSKNLCSLPRDRDWATLG